jgi:CheY-like chemotaxis protein
MIKNQEFRDVNIIRKVDEAISENIITDRMWFQENLFCILSNVISKSTSETVELSISMKSLFSCKKKKKVIQHQHNPFNRNNQYRLNLSMVLPMIKEEEEKLDLADDEVIEALDRKGVALKSGGVFANKCVCDRLSVDCTGGKNYLLIEVQSSAAGDGVAFDLTLEAFEAFYQSNYNVEASLYCLTKRVEALRGNYGVSARKDDKTGCVSWFMIPYLPDTSYCSPRLERLSALSHKNANLKTQFKMLVICNKFSCLEDRNDEFEASGHITEYVDNGPDALKMTMDKSASGTPYDAVLLDLDIPIKGNINYVRQLRQSEKARTDNLIPQLVIGVSQSMEHEETADALNSGVNAFSTSPISSKYLSDIINTFQRSYQQSHGKTSIAIDIVDDSKVCLFRDNNV